MKLVRRGKPGRESPGAADMDGKLRDLSGVIPDFGKFIAIGVNHATETGLPIPNEPVEYPKATNRMQGPNDPRMRPQGSIRSDWEVRLGVVGLGHMPPRYLKEGTI